MKLLLERREIIIADGEESVEMSTEDSIIIDAIDINIYSSIIKNELLVLTAIYQEKFR